MNLPTNNSLFLHTLLTLFLSLSLQPHLSTGAATISAGHPLSGNRTITSPGEIFELGFFSPTNTSNTHYIGIWYKNLPTNKTVVWVANRKKPVSDPSSSSLSLSDDGNLVLVSNNISLWSSNSSSELSRSPVATLLDNGNFVIRHSEYKGILIWQSFDHPTDTWLPGGKLGVNKLKNEKQALVSWKSTANPSPSLFSLEVERNGTSHLLLWNESRVYWTSGAWTGKIFDNVPELQQNYLVTNFTYITNDNESYFTYQASLPSFFTRFVLDVTGQLNQFAFGRNHTRWQQFWIKPGRQCGVYALCGAFGVCNQQNVSLCSCPDGFEPRSGEDWEALDHSGGCVRRDELGCGNGNEDDFYVMSNVELPDDSETVLVDDREECRRKCMLNCSCVAFSYEKDCLVWKGSLVNLEQLPSDAGRDLNIRVSSVDRVEMRKKSEKSSIRIVLGAAGGSILVCLVIFFVLYKIKRISSSFEIVEGSLAVFKYQDLKTATRNFSEKLGQGGFGSVYKGTLPDSAMIAVKSLNQNQGQQGQGEKQFRSEVKTIGQIQHINLVRLRGFCAESSKRFLIYDFMPNGSLESVLFGKNPTPLDWETRFKIAVGTARGLAYLHDKCRERIIHCDIKPENILLDASHNPRVADFGLAKLVGRDFSRVLTTIRGTRGYLAPEWLSGVAVTAKADVFSFGMVLLEIISGKRNSERAEGGGEEYYPYSVARAMSEGGEAMVLLDERLEGNAEGGEVGRACRVACWCIQDDERDRPGMATVVQALEGGLEVGRPNVPQFLRCFAEDGVPDGNVFFRETSSSSDLFM